MPKQIRTLKIDNYGLAIIGITAALLYCIIERKIGVSNEISVYLITGLAIAISCFIQVLVNGIKRSEKSLRKNSETVELNVRQHPSEPGGLETTERPTFKNPGTAAVIVDQNLDIVMANSDFLHLVGSRRETVEGVANWLTFVDDPEDRRHLQDMCRGIIESKGPHQAESMECQLTDRHGTKTRVQVNTAAIAGTSQLIASISILNGLKASRKKKVHQAFHDALTNLPNRDLFKQRLSLAIKRCRAHRNYHFALLCLDVDRFNLINDSYGHSLGDRLLIAYSRRIRHSLKDTDTLARIGGDTFLVLLEDIDNPDFAAWVARRLLNELSRPFDLDGNEVYASTSLGLVYSSLTDTAPEAIIRGAEAAMNYAKEKGGNQFKLFDQQLHPKDCKQSTMESDLRRAIDAGEFELHYQPIVAVADRTIIGFEALIRWNHPERGIIRPDRFLPVAETTGLIIPIGRWVLKEACCNLMRWQTKTTDPLMLFMSVNLSSKQFLRDSLLKEVKEILAQSGLTAGQLKLEITETTMMQDSSKAMRLIDQLKEMGIQIVIDDFGTGYSSMSYLQQLPVDTLKVDRWFISKIKHAHTDESIHGFETIITLARNLNINLVAKGVETMAQLSVLSDLNCQLAQGIYFSKPLDKKAMDRLLLNLTEHANTNSDSAYTLQQLIAS